MATATHTLPPRGRPSREYTLVTDADVAELHLLAEQLQGRPLPGVRVTESQFVRRYFHKNLKVEWVNREVYVSPPVSLDHNDLNFWLLCLVREFVEHHDLGRVFGIEVQVRLPLVPSRRNPDLLFVSNTSTSQPTATYLDGPPDLAMEIVSPDSIARDWRDKFLEYEKSGVREYWLIDSASQRCEVYTLGRSKKFGRLPQDPQGRIHSKVLRGLYFRPVWMWQTPRPKVADILKEWGIR